MTDGIYILANDVVHNQLVALLNSIEVNIGTSQPICIVPYDDRLDKVRAEIKTRKNVEMFEDEAAITRWEDFSTKIWQAHPTAFDIWKQQGKIGVGRMGMHRRFCAFDGPFEKFIYLDADTLVMGSLEPIFQKLNQYDFVVYDFQYKDRTHVYDVQSPKLLELFDEHRLNTEIFCAGFYGSKSGVFDQERRNYLLAKLREGDAEILYIKGPDQSILNYMVMKSGVSSYNFAHHLPKNQLTGCCVTSRHFKERNHILYDRGKQLTYLHYIGISTQLFNRLCAGENLACPYRELFLHYRYLHAPEQWPKFSTKPQPHNPPPSLKVRVLRKLGLAH